VNSKRLAILAALGALIGILVLWDGDETPEPPEETGRSAGDAQERQRASPPSAPGTGHDRGDWSRGPAAAYPPSYSGYPESYGGQFPGQPEVVETFRFRPLSERERQRIEQQAQVPYGAYPRSREPWQPRTPREDVPPRTYGGYQGEPWGPGWDGRGWGTEGYGMRPAEPPGRSRPRWESPYAAPVWPGEGYPSDPELFDKPPQWGVVPPQRLPPSQRMYPSLDMPRDRRLTAR
jgi:hypothetical protein